jgi:hypothetical protein
MELASSSTGSDERRSMLLDSVLFLQTFLLEND